VSEFNRAISAVILCDPTSASPTSRADNGAGNGETNGVWVGRVNGEESDIGKINGNVNGGHAFSPQHRSGVDAIVMSTMVYVIDYQAVMYKYSLYVSPQVSARSMVKEQATS